jgi:hypothetical protein
MCGAKLFSYNDFINDFHRENLNGIYLVNAGVMSYTGIIRSVNDDSIIMDIPLKFYAGENVMYTPVIIGKEEIVEIKEVPVTGKINIITKKDGEFSGEIITAYSNRVLFNSGGKNIILYYQDFVNLQ